MLLAMEPNGAEIEEMIAQDFSLPLARIETHYFFNHIFLPRHSLIDNLPKITHLPSVIIHGRYDMTCPAVSAVELHQRWPKSELHMVPLAGHTGSDPGILERIMYATEKFKGMCLG